MIFEFQVSSFEKLKDIVSIVRLGFSKSEIPFDALEDFLVAQAFQPVPEQPGAAAPHFLLRVNENLWVMLSLKGEGILDFLRLHQNSKLETQNLKLETQNLISKTNN